MTEIAVIIPFFQRSPGILGAALKSVATQTIADAAIRIVLVDDASPQSPDEDIVSVPLAPHCSIVRLEQENGGPGSARNRALDYLADTPPDYVALLDSDDAWEPDHLVRALNFLVDRADFYGSDHQRVGALPGVSFLTADSEPRRILDALSSPLAAPDDSSYYPLSGAQACNAFIRHYLVQTSTVVYRWDTLCKVRFDPSLRAAGEDNRFWIDCSALATRVIIDCALGSTCHEGVNIYESASSWDSPHAVRRVGYLWVMWEAVARKFDHSVELKALAKRRARNFERAFTFLWFRALLLHGERNAAALEFVRGRFAGVYLRMVRALAVLCFRRMVGNGLGFMEH